MEPPEVLYLSCFELQVASHSSVWLLLKLSFKSSPNQSISFNSNNKLLTAFLYGVKNDMNIMRYKVGNEIMRFNHSPKKTVHFDNLVRKP